MMICSLTIRKNESEKINFSFYVQNEFFKSRRVLSSYEVGNAKTAFYKIYLIQLQQEKSMKTYYFFNANCELIETAEFTNDGEAFDHCFTNPAICAWNDKPMIEGGE